MLRTPRTHALALLILLGVLFGLCVWYGSLAPAPAAWDLPGEERLSNDYDEVGGVVSSADPVWIVTGDGDDGRLRLRVTGVPSGDVTNGDGLRVYGVAQPDRTIRAIDAIVVPAWGRWYTWSISFVAGLWVLGRIVRHWRLEARGLLPRDRPRRVLSWVRARIAGEADNA